MNKAAFKTLRDDWGVNAVRLAMYTSEYNGYCAGGSKAALRNQIYKGVKYATDLGMYVIIDWHILNDGNPMTQVAEARRFFATMAKKYKKQKISFMRYAMSQMVATGRLSSDMRPRS